MSCNSSTMSLDSLIEQLKEVDINTDGDLFNQLIENENLSYKTLSDLFENPQLKLQFFKFLESNPNSFSKLSWPVLFKVVPQLSDKTINSYINQSLELLNKIYYKDFISKVGITNSDIDTITSLTSDSQYLLKFISCVVVEKVKQKKSLDNFLTKILPTVILYADRRFIQVPNISSQVVLILSKCIEIQYEQTEQLLVSIIEDLIDDSATLDSKVNFFIIFSLISLLFHVNADIGEQLFILDSIQLKKFTVQHLESHDFVESALEALSSACISKKSRALVAENFNQLVQTAFESSNNQSVQLLAASILVKTKGNSETNQKQDVELLNEFSIIFEDTIEQFSLETESHSSDYQIALEGLAYTSLLTTVKSRIINNKALLSNLIKTIDSDSILAQHSVWIYCSLCTLANITNYKPKLTAEQKRLRDLKNYAGKSNLDSDDESDELVHKRNKIALETGIVGVLSRNCPRLSKSSKETVAVLFRNLVTNQSHRSKFVQQGGLAVLIYLILPATTTSSTTTTTTTTIASSALAKSLISIDPKIAFSSKISPLVTIKPLIEQLENDSTDIPLLNSFEALLALTNIASIDDSCRNQIIRLGWTKLENLITTSNTLIQRATIELVCNLAMSPVCAEIYLNSSKPSTSKLELLAAFTDSDDQPTSTAASGALALLSEWGQPAVEVMGNNQKCINHLLSLLNQTDIDLCIRAISTIRNLVVGAKQFNLPLVIKNFNDKNTIDAIKQMLQTIHDNEIASLSLETIKILLAK